MYAIGALSAGRQGLKQREGFDSFWRSSIIAAETNGVLLHFRGGRVLMMAS